MKLLFVYRYLTIGGVETVIRARMRQLERAGVEAWAWFLNNGPGLTMFSALRNRVLVGDSFSIRSKIRNLDFSTATTFDSPEVIQFLNEASIPIFVESHSPYLENLGYLKDLKKNQLHAVLTPTAHQKRIVENHLRDRIPVYVVPNVLADEYLRVPFEQRPKSDTPIIGWVGRLDALKNWKGFLELGELLCHKVDRFELMLVGDFPTGHGGLSLYREAKKRDILNRLRWFRALHPDLIPNFFDYVRDSGGVIVSTSKGESFGMTIAEAMARACPVVVPCEGPFIEYVNDQSNGYLYPRGNNEEAARIISSLIHDLERQKEIGRSARNFIIEHFSPALTVKSFLSTISALH